MLATVESERWCAFCGRAHENCGCDSWDLPVGLLRVLGVTAVVALACHILGGVVGEFWLVVLLGCARTATVVSLTLRDPSGAVACRGGATHLTCNSAARCAVE